MCGSPSLRPPSSVQCRGWVLCVPQCTIPVGGCSQRVTAGGTGSAGIGVSVYGPRHCPCAGCVTLGGCVGMGWGRVGVWGGIEPQTVTGHGSTRVLTLSGQRAAPRERGGGYVRHIVTLSRPAWPRNPQSPRARHNNGGDRLLQWSYWPGSACHPVQYTQDQDSPPHSWASQTDNKHGARVSPGL